MSKTAGGHKPGQSSRGRTLAPHGEDEDMIAPDELHLLGGAIGSFGRALQGTKKVGSIVTDSRQSLRLPLTYYEQVRIDAPTRPQASNKRGRVDAFHSEPEDDEDEVPRKKSKRRSKSKAPKIRQPDSDTEMIDIDGDEEQAPRDGPQSHQLKYYKGPQKKVIDLGLFFFRLFMLNVNAFPDADELVTWSHNAFIAACKSFYGANFECEYDFLFTSMA